MSYLAYTLSNGVRESLRAQFPPKFPDFIGHHVTAWFGGNPPAELMQEFNDHDLARIKVIGYAADESLEALVVEVNGNSKRPDGKTYHVTWSLDRSKSRKPVDSNAVIAAGKVTAINFGSAFGSYLDRFD